jgi:hypothetical protein
MRLQPSRLWNSLTADGGRRLRVLVCCCLCAWAGADDVCLALATSTALVVQDEDDDMDEPAAFRQSAARLLRQAAGPAPLEAVAHVARSPSPLRLSATPPACEQDCRNGVGAPLRC